MNERQEQHQAGDQVEVRLAEYLVKVARRFRNGKVSSTSVMAAVSTSVAITLMIVLVTLPDQKSSADTPPSSTPTAASPDPGASAVTGAPAPDATEGLGPGVGGVDIKTHCDRLGFTGQKVDGEAVYCQSPVDLLVACQREHPTTVKFALEVGDPNSGSCLDVRGKNLGGVSDMLGHCRTAHGLKWADQVTTSDADNAWNCRIPMDLTAACVAQFNDSLMTARRMNGSWRCYRTR
jgi:hypothetical protein